MKPRIKVKADRRTAEIWTESDNLPGYIHSSGGRIARLVNPVRRADGTIYARVTIGGRQVTVDIK